LAGVALLGAVVLAVTGCGSSSVSDPPPGAAPTTAGPDSSTNAGSRAPTLGSGQAAISGTVEGPQGPAPGATVEIERVVNGVVARATITAGTAGAWDVRGVPGGSYSVRAWLPPTLAQTSPAGFFLTAQDNHIVTLAMTDLSTPLVQAAVAPNPPVTGQPAAVVVQVTARQVQPDGTVVDQPAVGQSVQLDGQGAWLIPSPNQTNTDTLGQATWTVTCESAGNQSLLADLGSRAVPLGLPACMEAPAPTTTTTTPVPTTSLPTTPQPTTPYPTAPYPSTPYPTTPYPTAPYPSVPAYTAPVPPFPGGGG
jgi:hypothetical protein